MAPKHPTDITDQPPPLAARGPADRYEEMVEQTPPRHTVLDAVTHDFAQALLANPRIEQYCGWPVSPTPGRDDRGAMLAALARSLAQSYVAYLERVALGEERA